MIRAFFYKFNRSFKNLKNVIFHVKLLSPTLSIVQKNIKVTVSGLLNSFGKWNEPIMNIMNITWNITWNEYNVGSVLWRLFSTLEVVKYIGGITSVLWGDSFSTVGG